jgi:hypothetical protein
MRWGPVELKLSNENGRLVVFSRRRIEADTVPETMPA